MARLASRESHAARACRQGEEAKSGVEIEISRRQFFALFARSA